MTDGGQAGMQVLHHPHDPSVHLLWDAQNASAAFLSTMLTRLTQQSAPRSQTEGGYCVTVLSALESEKWTNWNFLNTGC